MPKRYLPKDNPNHPFPPGTRDLRPDELHLGAPKAQAILQLFAAGKVDEGMKLVDRLNIYQLNEFSKMMLNLKAASEAKSKIEPNVMDFMIAEGKGQFQEAKHIRLMGEYIQTAEKPNTPHLWISMPPGHAKTSTVGFWEIVSYMARFPKRHNAFITHRYDLAERRTRRVRNWIRSDGKKFGLVLDEDSKAAGQFSLKSGGSLFAFGTGAGIAGYRFDGIVVIDDPVKGMEMVRSPDQRDNQWDWFLAEILNRLDPGGKIIGDGTRWHEDDLIGRCLARMQEVAGAVKFEYLTLPAIAEDDDILGREKGEPLWPARIPLDQLATYRATYTPFMWSCIYQQNPIPDEGVTFRRDWWQFYDARPEHFDVMIQSWDLAFGNLTTSDYVAGIVMGRRGPHVYILDVIRRRMDFDESIKAIRAWSIKYPLAGAKLVERAANGWAAITTLSKEIPGICPIPPKTSKEIRAQAVQPFIQAGNVWLPKQAPWLDDFIRELSQFGGGGKYDDQCFVAGTQVACSDGPRSIEDVQPGMLVVTPSGLRLVRAAGSTGLARVVSALGLTGTPGHPIYDTASGSFVPLVDALTQVVIPDRLSACGQIRWALRSLFPSWGSRITGWEASGGTTWVAKPSGEAQRDSTSPFGRLRQAGRCLAALKSITRTRTPSTTLRTISNAYAVVPTEKPTRTPTESRRSSNISRRFGFFQWLGIAHQKGELGIVSMLKWVGSSAVASAGFVPSAAGAFGPSGKLGSANGLTAGPSGADSMGSIRSIFSARTADSRQQPTETQIPSGLARPAAEAVPDVPVFNLQVDGGVYYANGVLVHNCDAFTQGLNYLMFGAYGSREAAQRAATQAKPPATIHEIYARQFSSFYHAKIDLDGQARNMGLTDTSHHNYPQDRVVMPGGGVV